MGLWYLGHDLIVDNQEYSTPIRSYGCFNLDQPYLHDVRRAALDQGVQADVRLAAVHGLHSACDGLNVAAGLNPVLDAPGQTVVPRQGFLDLLDENARLRHTDL